MEINILNNDSNKLADCINGLGNAYLGLKQLDSAAFYLNQSSAMYHTLGNVSGESLCFRVLVRYILNMEGSMRH